MMSKSTYNYLLFDWDGCLSNSLPIWLSEYKRVFAKYHVFPSDAEIAEKAFGDWQGPLHFGITDYKTCLDEVLTGANNRMRQVPLHNGVKDVLLKLKKQKKVMSVVTSSLYDIVYPAIKYHQLENIFDAILTKKDFTKEKPDPEIIYKAMEKLHAVKKETIIIGDSEKDILAGKNAGITTVVFYPPENELFYKRKTLEALQPDYLLNRFEELQPLVK